MSVNLMIIVYVLIVVAMVAFILVQKSSGATAGSAFGSGASSTVFGAKGSGNFLTKTTMILAFLFFAISMMMAVEAKKQFSAESTGEIDLGVVGTLDTESDIPEISSLDPVKDAEASDVPSIDVTTEKVSDAVDTAVEKTTDEVKAASDDLQQQAEDTVEEAKDAVEEEIDSTEPNK